MARVQARDTRWFDDGGGGCRCERLRAAITQRPGDEHELIHRVVGDAHAVMHLRHAHLRGRELVLDLRRVAQRRLGRLLQLELEA